MASIARIWKLASDPAGTSTGSRAHSAPSKWTIASATERFCGANSSPGRAGLVEGRDGDRAQALVAGQRLCGRFPFRRQQHLGRRRGELAPGTAGFVVEDDDLLADRAAGVAPDQDTPARARDPGREPVGERAPVGLSSGVARGVEHLPAGGIGVAYENELRVGRRGVGGRPEFELARAYPNRAHRER